jgi:DNA polymerase-1
MAKRKSSKAMGVADRAVIPLSLPFMEDQALYGAPRDVLRCAGKTVVLDTETTGLDWWRDQMVGLAVWCPEAQVKVFIPTLTASERVEVKEAVRVTASNPDTRILAHNLKFDAHFLELRLWEVNCKLLDTAVMLHLQDSRQRKSLAAAEQRWLGTRTKEHYRGDQAEVHRMPLGAMAEYAINDCRITALLAQRLAPELAQLKLTTLLRMQMQYVRLLQRIEARGMLLDETFVVRALARFQRNLVAMEQELFAAIPGKRVFNWRSDEQLSHAVYDWYGWERPKNPYADADGVDRSRFADRGKYNSTSTSAFLLMEKAEHPLGGLIMAMRETDKLATTLQSWHDLADHSSGQAVLHTSFNENGTRTGRLSSSRPNWQNMPSDVRTRETQSVYSGGTTREAEYNLRLAIRARPGNVLLSVDHKQQEMKLFAVIAKIPQMLEAIKQRLDIHAEIAKSVWPEDIARDPSCLKVRREWSKTIGFGLLYGGTTGSLEHRLNKSRDEAAAIAAAYWERFPRILPFLHETVEECKQHKLVRYWSGRIWREEDEQHMYKGTNAKVQGGAADLMAIAAMRCQAHLDGYGSGAGIASIIHDELLFELPAEQLTDAVVADLQRTMEVEDLFGVPFGTDVKAGPSYGSMGDLVEFRAQLQGGTHALAEH